MKYPVIRDRTRLKIFYDTKKRRMPVGELSYNSKTDRYELVYDKQYACSAKAIGMGPTLGLSKLKHCSEKGKMFPILLDRIPDRRNPAYEDYCEAERISPDETNPIVLLSSIGRRGPSSFIFEPIYHDPFDGSDIKQFRKTLEITQHDFAAAFGLSKTTLQRIEAKKSHDPNILRLIQIFIKFPEVAIWQLQQTGIHVKRPLLLQLAKHFKAKLEAINKIP